MSKESLLTVRGLEKQYQNTSGWLRRTTTTVRAVDGISFDVRRGQTVGIVGESGCGKSTTALSILRLEEPTGGEIRFDGECVGEFDSSGLKEYRRRVQFVMQDPESAFNPRMTVGTAIAEPLKIHGMTDADRRKRIVRDVLERVGLNPNATDSYPHEFSGGEKQRLALARALVLNPDLIIADEPTSALDGRTKADVLRLMNDLKDEFDLAILLISHDIDLVSRFCDRVNVMYLGKIVEQGPMEQVVTTPHHPYTRTLLASVPNIDPSDSADGMAPRMLTNELPDAADIPEGCRFHPRCPAIIPPDHTALPAEEWRNLTALRLSLEDAVATTDDFIASLSADETSVNLMIRESFDLPAELSDPASEARLTDAISALEDGEYERAKTQLEAVPTSICERDEPPRKTDQAVHSVACHRYVSEQPGRPLTNGGE